MEEIILDKIEWSAPEYNHTEKSNDFLWTIALVAVVASIIAIWYQNFIFGVFILISGATLILFSVRQPKEMNFSIETSGLTMGQHSYSWKGIKGFAIKKEPEAKLLIELDKYFLPVYTLPLPSNLVDKVKENLIKVIPNIELEESKSMKFMERIGF